MIPALLYILWRLSPSVILFAMSHWILGSVALALYVADLVTTWKLSVSISVDQVVGARSGVTMMLLTAHLALEVAHWVALIAGIVLIFVR